MILILLIGAEGQSFLTHVEQEHYSSDRIYLTLPGIPVHVSDSSVCLFLKDLLAMASTWTIEAWLSLSILLYFSIGKTKQSMNQTINV